MIEGLANYPAYRPSGDAWLIQLPASWEQIHLGKLSSVRVERNPGNLPLLSVFLDRGVIPYGEGGGRVHAPSLDLSKYQVVKPGDFVLNNQQAWRGSVGVSRHHGIISPAYIVLNLSRALNPIYANYLFRSPSMVDQFIAASKGVGDIQRQVFWPFLRRVTVPVPPPDEQSAIVRFLNHANHRIDRYIRAKKKLISLLNEQKQAIIHRAVTRGLNPNVPMKESGVPWLGQIPAHWEVRRIKHILREVDLRSVTGNEVLLSMRMHHGLVPFADHYARPPQAATLVGFKVVRSGQLVINRMQAGNGVIFPSSLYGLVSPDYAVFDTVDDVNVNFIGELFRSINVRVKFRAESRGLGTGTSGFLRLYNDRLGAIQVALPKRNEQDSILVGLGTQLEDLNVAWSRTEREISLMREYHTRLVADVVTGQLDVREVARNLPSDEIESEASFDRAEVYALEGEEDFEESEAG